ncbi:MAG: radical SAM protein [Brevinematales bacterium]|jgi:MoaA/NifB/PqqE/SkfB family radical SAM enzyme
MGGNTDFKNTLDRNILYFFRKLISFAFVFPHYLPFLLRMMLSQLKAIGRRKYWKSLSLEVPPIIIASITGRCNLECSGCFNKLREHKDIPDMERKIFLKILGEAGDIGSRIIFLSGGEPMTCPELIEATGNYPDLLFPLFTNGLLIDESYIKAWKKQKNIIPVISLEGDEDETDRIRGKGIFHKIESLSLLLKKSGILYGHSMTATKNNYKLLSSREFISLLYKNGARIFIFVEFQPVGSDRSGELSPDEKEVLLKDIAALRSSFPGIFIEFPGEEEQYGGCLSAGRGFLHISPGGSLEPCPFSPYSDSSLKNMTLKDALKSKFLERIRDNTSELSEVSGCALLQKREWVKSLLQ